MDTIDKTLSMDIDLGTLLGSLDGIEALPLVFRYDGRSVRPACDGGEERAIRHP
ncbi:hypothetical protein [Rhizobium sp. AC44/96]|uniref:hypothetical protein n=1 Tax=Rhizobium sp. AC44/96 TaxID=1841654 RepID=UPI001FCE07BE|nr:hypothetical protein [Rhizobium sp. AC44/96]